MQVSFEQSGGFAGIPLRAQVDSDKLPAEEAEKLAALVEEADFFHLPPRIAVPRPQPDRFQYLVEVTRGKEHHAVMVSEEAIPPRLAPLLEWLKEKARSERQKAISERGHPSKQ